jgi:GcrA cell cycle regulator
MRTKGASKWTEAQDSDLRRMWDVEGLSSGDIAHVMGMTRNAVIGRARRLDLSMRASKVQPRIKPRKTYELAAPRKPRPVLNAMRQPGPVFLSAPDMKLLRGAAWSPLPGTAPVTLVDLDRGMCKWPVGDTAPFLFCGASCEGSYCETHQALSAGQGTPSERDAHKWKEAA